MRTPILSAILISLIGLSVAGFAQTQAPPAKPVSNPSKPATTTRWSGMTEKRLDELLGQMTLKEKIGQLSQGQIYRPDVEQSVREGSIGSIIAGGRPTSNDLQRVAVEQSRLGIPLLVAYDVIHGYRSEEHTSEIQSL